MTAVERARERLEKVTPLESDCGRICGAACCRSLEGEETGMLLFPGEEDFYRDKPGWKILKGSAGNVVVCPGTCDRRERPLSCRLFPLLPLLREGKVRTGMDQRARAVCPLFSSGLKGISEAFRKAVRETGEILAETDEGREMLIKLTEMQDELKSLHGLFQG